MESSAGLLATISGMAVNDNVSLVCANAYDGSAKLSATAHLSSRPIFA
jgi:hypothetical protein